MNIRIFRTCDSRIILPIMTRPDIWATVAEDGQDIELYVPDVTKDCWLMVCDEEKGIIGLFQACACNSITLELHPCILPEYRKKYSRAAGVEVLQWIYDTQPWYLKIVAQIPVIYENVKQYAVSFGFQMEGVNRLSYLKNGKVMDQWRLGITRDEIKRWLDGRNN